MPKYAPAREDGLKPYVVERSEWGRKTEAIYYAENSGSAKYRCKGRQMYVTVWARRATPEDMQRLRVVE